MSHKLRDSHDLSKDVPKGTYIRLKNSFMEFLDWLEYRGIYLRMEDLEGNYVTALVLQFLYIPFWYLKTFRIMIKNYSQGGSQVEGFSTDFFTYNDRIPQVGKPMLAIIFMAIAILLFLKFKSGRKPVLLLMYNFFVSFLVLAFVIGFLFQGGYVGKNSVMSAIPTFFGFIFILIII